MNTRNLPSSSVAPQAGLGDGRELTAEEAALFRKRKRRALIALLSLIAVVPVFVGLLMWGSTADDVRERVSMVDNETVVGSFMGAKKHGLFKTYYPNGILKDRTQWALDVRHGLTERWYFDGTKERSGRYSYGKRDGIWRTYYPGGVKKSEFVYSGGVPTGTWRTFYESGQLEFYREYDAGLQHGKDLAYYESGQLASDVNYIHGERDGSGRYFNKEDRQLAMDALRELGLDAPPAEEQTADQ